MSYFLHAINYDRTCNKYFLYIADKVESVVKEDKKALYYYERESKL